MNRKPSQLIARHTPWFTGALQACLIVCSLTAAWLLRFDFVLQQPRTLWYAIPVLLPIRLAAISYFGLLRGWWRYAGVSDGVDVVKAVGAGSILFFLTTRLVLRIASFPRAIYLLEALLTAGMLIGMRLLVRLVAESLGHHPSPSKRVILIGAGSAAQIMLREIQRPGSGYVAVACLDDDPSKLRVRVHGVRVLGGVDRLPAILSTVPADEVLIAVPSATGAQMLRFADICTRARIPFHSLPALKDIALGGVKVKQCREVSLEDLLGRDPVQINLEAVRWQVQGKSVMVTGAAGSIGSELCRQLLQYGPRKLICVDQNETGMFYLQEELRPRRAKSQLVCCVADVSNLDSMRSCFSTHPMEHIFHAAAYKHVPVMEENVAEAIRNNVFALENLLNVAEEKGCQSFVLISSDKAVNPTSVMGSSKRIGELMLAARPKKNMRCVSVRFGNVLGSTGSVIPILQKQLEQGRPFTITHPEIRRFFMTTQEAVSLVLGAFALGRDGDILVLEMGEPIKIVDIARALIRLSGRPEDSIRIQFTGLREGEKLEEQLCYDYETILPTGVDKIKRINIKGATPNWIQLSAHLKELRSTLNIDGARPIRAKIKEIVPEYRCPSDSAQDISHMPDRRREDSYKSASADD